MLGGKGNEMEILDCDAHVEESPATFADPYWDPALADRRPQVVPRGQNAAWLIEDRLLPKLAGAGANFFATPAGVAGRPTALTAVKRDSLESAELRDIDARLRQMDQEGIYLQVIYPTLFLAHPLAEDIAFANALYRSYNSWISEVCAQRAERLKWVCVVNLDDVDGARAELRRCKQELDAIGVMVLGTAGDRKLDHPALDPFWAEAEALSFPVAVHVGWPSPSLGRIFDNSYDALTAPFYFSLFTGFIDVLAGGVLDRHPRLRVAFLEAGIDWLPFMVGRMEHRAAMQGNRYGYAAARTPREYLKSGNIFVGCEVDDEFLPRAIELLGEDQLLFASDMPHGDREYDAARRLMERNDLSEQTKGKILTANTARFYGF